jgi:hypothetical protein
MDKQSLERSVSLARSRAGAAESFPFALILKRYLAYVVSQRAKQHGHRHINSPFSASSSKMKDSMNRLKVALAFNTDSEPTIKISSVIGN